MRYLYLFAAVLTLTVAALGQSVGTVSPTSLNFGPIFLGDTSSKKTVKFQNTGNATLVVSSVSVSAPFAITGTKCATVKAGKSCNLSITYTPQAIGSSQGSLTITWNASTPPPTVSLAGAGSNFKNLHNFTGPQITPVGGLSIDSLGNLYGTTEVGGNVARNGTFFELNPQGTQTSMYSFRGIHHDDGSAPASGLIRDSEGNMYGTTLAGGEKTTNLNCGLSFPGCGVVYEVSADGTETNLYSFQGAPSDGQNPAGAVVMDSAGNLYGTTFSGGTQTNASCYSTGCGTIFKLTPSGVESVLYNFCSQPNCTDGSEPYSSLVIDAQGNLYGTTSEGGSSSNCGTTGCGTIFELSPSGTETVLYSFNGYPTDGAIPMAGMIMDAEGNLYGTTTVGGSAPNCSQNGIVGCGTVFKFTPNGPETILHNFTGRASDGATPYASLITDAQGNFYSTTYAGGKGANCAGEIGCGTIFKLTPTGAESLLYTFCSEINCADGSWPFDGLIMDAQGILYGTASSGGAGNGMVFKLNPNE